jgi:hypothetical protein
MRVKAGENTPSQNLGLAGLACLGIGQDWPIGVYQ